MKLWKNQSNLCFAWLELKIMSSWITGKFQHEINCSTKLHKTTFPSTNLYQTHFHRNYYVKQSIFIYFGSSKFESILDSIHAYHIFNFKVYINIELSHTPKHFFHPMVSNVECEQCYILQTKLSTNCARFSAILLFLSSNPSFLQQFTTVFKNLWFN